MAALDQWHPQEFRGTNSVPTVLALVAGIKPDAPGFERVLIAPHLGKLTSVEAAMPREDAMIRVSYTRTRDTFKAKIELPLTVKGKFEFQGRQWPLHGGLQEFTVPAR